MTECTPNQQAERLSEALQGKAIRGGWRAHCPAHDDHEPSLDITIKGGRVLWICRAGCDQPRVLGALRDRGLWPREGEWHRPVQPARGEPSARYRYVDASGQALTLLRYDEMKRGERRKRFTWIGPNGQTGLQGAKPLIYRAERLRGLPRDTPIVWCEGPKCVELVESLGLVATCGYSGTTVTIDESDVALLSGHEVWIVPDNDEPGRKHGQEVMAKLKAAGLETVWVDLPGLPKKGDVEQWIAAGGTRETFLELVERAKASGADGKPAPVLIRLSDVQREHVQWLWHPFIPIGSLTMMDGDPGIGKSFLTCMIASTVTQGWKLPGDPRTDAPPGAVLLLAGEDGLGETVRGRCEDSGADLERITCMTALMREDGEHTVFLDPDGLYAIERAIRRVSPVLVIIDPVVNYLGGKLDTGKANQVRAVLRPLADLARRHACSFLLTRHLTKATMGKALYRGQMSMDFNGAARSVLIVDHDPEDPDAIVMAQTKVSAAKKGASQKFYIADGPNGPTVQWSGVSSFSADELLGEEEGERRGALDEVKELMTSLLFEGPMPSRSLLQHVRDLGYSESTFRRARTDLGLAWERRGTPGGRGAGDVWIKLPLLPVTNTEESAPAYTPVPPPINLLKPSNGNGHEQVNAWDENGAATPESNGHEPGDPINLLNEKFEQVNRETASEHLTSASDDDEEIV